jgi:hypothetical protein
MPDLQFERLQYRGNYQVTCEVDFSESLLSARYAGGFREDVVIGSPNGLRAWRLSYPALHKHAPAQTESGDHVVESGEIVSREQYIWRIYCRSKAGGNIPVVLRCPMDGKDYLCIFPEDRLSFTLLDHYMRTTGVQLEQTYVKGVNTLDDGSLGSPGEPPNPDEI